MAWRSNRTRNEVLKGIKSGVEIILFDTETTGLSAEKERIIELAAIKYQVQDDLSLKEVGRYHQYIQPRFLISQTIIDLTGITNEQLSAYPYEEDVFEDIKNFFGNPYAISGHNVDFDIRFLNALYERNNTEPITPVFIFDTLEFSRDLVVGTENHKLGTIAHMYGLDEGVEFHSAIEDVQVTAKLFEIFVKTYFEDEGDSASTDKIKPNIERISYWVGYRGFSRIYVQTDYGSVYYDIRKKVWENKDMYNFNEVDMQYLEDKCLEITNSANLIEFARFKGTVTL